MTIHPPIRLTPTAMAILTLANKTAYSLNHNYIGTEHLLLAVCDHPHVSDDLKKLLDFDCDKVKALLTESVGTGPDLDHVHERIPITPRVKKIIALAGIIAGQEFGQAEGDHIHLFLALLKEGSGLAARVLHQTGYTYESVIARFPDSISAKNIPFQKDPDLAGLVVVFDQKIACHNGYTLSIKTLEIPDSQPAVRSYLIELSGSVNPLKNKLATADEVNAFLKGVSTASAIYGHAVVFPDLNMD